MQYWTKYDSTQQNWTKSRYRKPSLSGGHHKAIDGYMEKATVETDELKKSAEKVGHLYPVLADHDGRIVDGEHRLAADQDWPRVILEHIKTEKTWLVARFLSNNVRRTVPPLEKRLLLQQLAKVLVNDGMPPERIAYAIAEEAGMSYRWVTKPSSSKPTRTPSSSL